MKTSILIALRATTGLAALVVLTGCSTLPLTGGKWRSQTAQANATPATLVSVEAPEAPADAEPSKPSRIQNLINRVGETLRCGAIGAAAGFFGPLLIAGPTAGASVYLIPVTAPALAVVGVIKGAEGKCDRG